MVWLREIDFMSDPRDTQFEVSARHFITNLKPFKASSVDCKAYLPPQPNPIDAFAPAAIGGLALIFLFV
jgi:hypothetical protein